MTSSSCCNLLPVSSLFEFTCTSVIFPVDDSHDSFSLGRGYLFIAVVDFHALLVTPLYARRGGNRSKYMVRGSLPIHKVEDETRDTCDAFELTGSTASFPGSPEGPTPRRRKLPSVYEPLHDSQVLRVVSRTTARR